MRALLAASWTLLLLSVVFPSAHAHISDATATAMDRGPAMDHTMAFSLAVHANGTYGVIGSMKVARDAGVNFSRANVTFHVVQGPAQEFSGNGSRFNLQGDIFAEFRDLDNQEDVVRLEVRFTGVDSSLAWKNTQISHALAAFSYPGFDTEGNATAPFYLAGDPSLKPPETKTTPAPGALLVVALVVAVVTRCRGRPGPSCGR